MLIKCIKFDCRNKFIDRNIWYNEGRLKTDFKVVFKENEFFAMIRRKHFTEIDILSFIGGLLGNSRIFHNHL